MSAPQESALYGGETLPSHKAPSISEQFLGIFTEPGALFDRLAKAPAWGLAFIVLLVSAGIMTFLWAKHIDLGAFFQREIENSVFFKLFPNLPRPTDAQIDDMIAKAQGTFLMRSMIQTPIILSIAMLLTAVYYWIFSRANTREDRPTFKHALSLASVVGLVHIPRHLLIGFICVFRGVGGVRPDELAPTSLAYFIHSGNPKLTALLGWIDPFTISLVALSIYGMKRLMGAKPWAAYVSVLLPVGLSFIFGVVTA